METSRHHEGDLSALIAHLYDAAMDPGAWPGTASRIAQALGSTSTVVKLHGVNGHVSLLECTSNLVLPERDRAWADDWHRRDLWVERSVARGVGRIITDEDLVGPEEQPRSGFYQEWLPRLGIQHMLGAVFPVSPGVMGVLGIHRPRDAGGYTDRERRQAAFVLPHLQRALQIGQRLSVLAQQHSAAPQALDRFDAGVLIVDSACRIIQASPRAEALLRECPELVVDRGRLSLQPTSLRDKLSALVHAAVNTALARAVKTDGAPLVPRPQRTPLVLSVAPLRPQAGFHERERPAAMVFIRDTEAPLAAQRLRELFGLTCTEAAVAAGLGDGKSLEDIAVDLGIGIGTVRTHLKRVLAKTGTRRQGQLVALLARVAQPS